MPIGAMDAGLPAPCEIRRGYRVAQSTGRREAGRGGNGEGQDRTGDTTIFSRVLYQLSYLAE